MHTAVRRKHAKVVKALRDCGALTSVVVEKFGFRETPLDLARRLKCKPIVTLLEQGPSKPTGKKKAAEEPDDPPKGKTAKTEEPGAQPMAKRFAPPSAAGGAHYEISEGGRCAVGKGGDNSWTALGGVLAVGEAVAFKNVEGAGLVGVAPRDEVWDDRYGLEGAKSLGAVRGGIALSCMGNLKINGDQGPSGLRGFDNGDIIELRRIGERCYRWSKNGEVVVEHEAPASRDPDKLYWGVSAYLPDEKRTLAWEIVEAGAATD